MKSLTALVCQKDFWVNLVRHKQEKLTSHDRRYMMTHVANKLDVTKYLDSLPRRVSPYIVDYSSMGFALKNYTEASKVSSQDVITFLRNLFLQGEQKDKRKTLPVEAVELMRNAKKDCGERRFKRNDWLKENQIRNLFGRFGTCLRKNRFPDNVSVPQDELEDSISENIRKQKISLDAQISSELVNPKSLDDENCPIMASITILHVFDFIFALF